MRISRRTLTKTALAYGLHTVRLPESTAVRSAGAALVVVYRNPSEPLTKVVMYDGASTHFDFSDGVTLAQPLMGFFQHTGNAGQLTHLVGTGGDIEPGGNQTEQLFFNGTNVGPINPFPHSPISDRSWAFPTFQNLPMNGVTSANGYGRRATTTVTYQRRHPEDCATWSAIIFSTPVLDVDQDGLPDALEASSNSPGGAPWRNPDGPDPDVRFFRPNLAEHAAPRHQRDGCPPGPQGHIGRSQRAVYTRTPRRHTGTPRALRQRQRY